MAGAAAIIDGEATRPMTAGTPTLVRAARASGVRGLPKPREGKLHAQAPGNRHDHVDQFDFAGLSAACSYPFKQKYET